MIHLLMIHQKLLFLYLHQFEAHLEPLERL